jgi:glycosyltransferase involved in cell wall biosynthesis
MTKPLKVVLACDTFAPDINGAARFAERLAGGLVRNGNEVHIITPAFDSSEGPRIEEHDGVNMIVHRLRSHRVPQHKTLRWPEPWGMTKKIGKILDDVEPIAVHIQSHLMVGRFANTAARRRNIKVLATNHIMPENLIKYSLLPKFLHGWAMKVVWTDAGRILRKMDAVTTPTKRAAELLEKAAGVTGVLAISCGIDASRFANDSAPQNKNPIALFLGRLDDEKRVDVLLRAVASLSEHPNLRIELVGDGGERERLKKLAQSLGISDRVTFLGHVTDEELPGIYERATVFVMPSIAELQSIATMEAMASGRPVIGADAMALPHLVHDGDNGYLFPPNDVEALADRLKRILTADQSELNRLSENSLHLIQAHDINRTVKIFEDIYLGVGDASPTTDDNKPSYMAPIGRLNESVRSKLVEWRSDALALRSRAEGLRQEARERLVEMRQEVRGQLSDLRKEIQRQAKKLRRRTED